MISKKELKKRIEKIEEEVKKRITKTHPTGLRDIEEIRVNKNVLEVLYKNMICGSFLQIFDGIKEDYRICGYVTIKKCKNNIKRPAFIFHNLETFGFYKGAI
jgi:Holliday junction resolvasome RuvABC endonuclease subunit